MHRDERAPTAAAALARAGRTLEGCSTPIRVGLVIGQLSAGGAEGQLELLCRDLDRAAFAPTVYCLSARVEPHGPRIEAAGIPVRAIHGSRLSRIVQLRHYLRADDIEVVHAWLYIANGYAWAANLGAHRSMITSARNCKVQGSISRHINRLAFGASRAIVVNSRDVAAYVVRQYGAPEDRLRVIYNAIDTRRFAPAGGCGGNGGGAEDPPAPIVTVGRLVEQKNHRLFLRAAAGVLQDVPKARFVIVGDGPLRAALEQQAYSLGIAGRVTFTGERRNVEEILRGASLFWLTSRWEGLPNAVLEAMASGVPAIVTDVGGTRELVRSGVDGFVVPSGEVDAFVRHSCALLREPARRRQFGGAARARAEEFSSARLVRALGDLYQEVVACKR